VKVVKNKSGIRRFPPSRIPDLYGKGITGMAEV